MKKFNLLVPLAGKGTRMAEGGYSVPKPLIPAGDKPILDWSLSSIDMSECDLIFVILEEQAYNFSLDIILRNKYPNCSVVIIDSPTRGSVETCYLANALIEGPMPLIIFCPDVYFEPQYVPDELDFMYDGFLLTFKANSANYSYVLKEGQFVTQTQEKTIISQDAAVGIYCFKTGDLFLKYAKQMIDNEITTRGEFFLCPLYNLLIEDGLKVTSSDVETIYIMGTYEELTFFETSIFPYLNGPTEWVLCADHSGYLAKETFKRLLLAEDQKVLDVGCFTNKDCDYWDYLHLAQKRLGYAHGAYGVGFCRSGQGMNIAANKMKGIRAALVHNDRYAHLAVQHNAANFFSIPSGSVNEVDMGRMINCILLAKFEGGRHQNRLQKIENI